MCEGVGAVTYKKNPSPPPLLINYLAYWQTNNVIKPGTVADKKVTAVHSWCMD